MSLRAGTARGFAPARANPLFVHPEERRLSLAGRWGFRLDPDDRGLAERWYRDAGLFSDPIDVPGCWQGQGHGGDAKEMIWDFRLWARVFRATYAGTGWYGRTFRAPDGWRGARMTLAFGGVHPSAEVWLNGIRLGEHHEPFVPFGFDVTDLVRPDADNVLAVRVHEEARIMGLAYGWQGNWSGLYRAVDLVAAGTAFVDGLRVYPDAETGRMRLVATMGGDTASAGPLTVRATVRPAAGDGPVTGAEVQASAGQIAMELDVPSPRLWSPDAPNLYRVDVALVGPDGATLDAASERTGFVKLSTDGKRFLINGEPYYMRGTGEFTPWPETGSPDTDRVRLRRKLAALRDYGYNCVRCQSYVPAPEYYDAADEVGLLVQSEMGMLGAWGSHTEQHVYAWPQPTPGIRAALTRQWDHVVLRDVNHPSANIYCMSNELGSMTHFPRTAWRCYRDTKAIKPMALVIWTDGGHAEDLPGDFVNAEANVDPKTAKPVIQHEFRWWSSFPDVTIMGKYSGAIRPYAAQMALEAAARHGISHVLPAAAKTSQRLQFLEAKAKMEMCRRDNPTLAGICHFNAMDANPSPQGIIDEFHERKYADAATWRETNGDTVVLSSLGFDDRVLAPGDALRVDLFVSDFSHPPFVRPAIEWRLVGDDAACASGRIDPAHEPFRTYRAGTIEATVPGVEAPVRARLEARVVEGGRGATNRWDLWVVPPSKLPVGTGVHGAAEHTWLRTLAGVEPAALDRCRVALSERLDDALVAFVRGGGRAIIAASEGLVRPFNSKFGFTVGHYYFTPPANYPPYEDGHDGTIIQSHPMLGGLPHEGFADLVFFRMMQHAPPLDLEPLGLNDADPVIRVMHSYPVGRSLGYLVERRLGAGGIIISALELDQAWPEARWLLAAMCGYAASDAFAPQVMLGDDALAAIRDGLALP